ncbi:hypothetical protein AN191_14860 [Loktanella sp. 5RATIMAR09]|uniref:hypothetical protein n=1 Tax=Loktanella sp. 5RATIMAR09 TaxID=1225655 RepID=UPI0006EB80B4|nr:hypothetical protein [Loktanella sp. 5RATIMAR09]KQI70987.1 hypothetical protein AN191_14860 [Loktanella sp. 5RATIMAR09]
MQIAFHIGANCTDEDRLLKSVLRNADVLLQQGIAVPGPGRYRKLLREAIDALDGAPPTPDARDVLLDAIVEDDKITRLVLSNDNFLTVPRRIFDHGVFYHQAEKKVRGLHSLFPDDDIMLFMGMRHPASFLQETATRAGVTGLSEYLGLLAPLELRWSDVIRRIKRAAPQTPLYVWCNEDTPLIWEELIRLFSAIPADMPVAGQFDVLSGIVSAAGLELLTSGITALDHDDIDARQDLIADILETHALPEQLEDRIDLPELTDAVVQAMTASYEADLDVIRQMEGVELILPFD